MNFLFGKRRIPLGRLLTYVSLLLLPVMLILMFTNAPQAAPGSGKIEVTMSTEDTKDFERAPEEGYSSLEKQESAEIVAEQSCNYANVHCAQGEMSLTAKINSLLTAIVAFNKQGAEQDSGNPTSYVQNNGKTLFGFATKAIASVYTPPASGAYYVADAIDNIGISKTAYAQGFGYYGLQPFLTTWKVMRNFVYVAFSVVIIGVAISILMRQSFGGQNSVTVQQMLPNIIITLIVITFSYAIAGFLIDLMYWIMYAVGSFIQVNTGGSASGGGAGGIIGGGGGLGVDYILSFNIFEVFTTAMSAGFVNTYSGVSSMVEGLFTSTLGIGWLVGKISGVLAAFVMVVIVLVNVFKLFFILAKSYVYVVLYTIFAPFILTMQAFKPGTFKRWLLSVAANLSPFVLTFFMLVFLGICNAVFKENSAGGWVPPFMFGTSSVDSSAIGSVVVIGMILAMNEIITEFKKMIGGEGGFFEKMGNVAMDQADKRGLTGAAKKGATLAPYLLGRSMAIGGFRAYRSQPGNKWREAKAAIGTDIRENALSSALGGINYVAQRNLSKEGAGGTIGQWTKDIADHSRMISIATTNQRALSGADSLTESQKKLLSDTTDWRNSYGSFTKIIDWKNQGRRPVQTYATITK